MHMQLYLVKLSKYVSQIYKNSVPRKFFWYEDSLTIFPVSGSELWSIEQYNYLLCMYYMSLFADRSI